MSIVIVGGHDRMHDEYKMIGQECGMKIKIFTKLPPRFSKSIGSPDAIVLFTSTVSHKMANIANQEAKKKKIHIERCHSSSGTCLKETLEALKVS